MAGGGDSVRYVLVSGKQVLFFSEARLRPYLQSRTSSFMIRTFIKDDICIGIFHVVQI